MQDIIAQLEAATASDRRIDAALHALWCADNPQERGVYSYRIDIAASDVSEARYYTSSIDAALTLAPHHYRYFSLTAQHWQVGKYQKHPYTVELYADGHEHIAMGVTTHWVRGEANTLAIAICIAALKARAA